MSHDALIVLIASGVSFLSSLVTLLAMWRIGKRLDKLERLFFLDEPLHWTPWSASRPASPRDSHLN